MAVLVIVCILKTVIINSKRYYYLETKEAEEFRKFLGLRHVKEKIYSYLGHLIIERK